MYKKPLIASVLAFSSLCTFAQSSLQQGLWRASLVREDGNPIVFNLDVKQEKGKTVFYVVNGEERMAVRDITAVKDSLLINMPVFESSFRLKKIRPDSLAGSWIRKGVAGETRMPVTVSAREPYRFAATAGEAKANAAGKWKIAFATPKGTEPAIGQFTQQGSKVTGSVLTPSGDYRFLSGTVTGNLLQLSTFDGVHALVFRATVAGDSLTNGKLFSGKSSTSSWTGIRDAGAVLPAEKLTRLKDGESGQLDFAFTDLDGKKVSIHDERFKNKVVVIQLMGSWCPNCMDETEFMSAYYKENKHRGVEMIGLAYEYTTDLERSKASLRKFQQRFDVQYPLLITPAAVTDSLRTEKTLPQLTAIKVFPTTLILDKTGKVAEITTDFFGPGTGEYFTRYKEQFGKTIDELLAK